jgi:tRNA threonylcarbamoyladenosine biosynthesis protein TsaE
MRIANFMPSATVSRREIETHSGDETISLGRQIGTTLKAPVLILLTGDLGAGKTTLTKGIVSGAGGAEEEDVTSPTFALVHKHVGDAKSDRSVLVYHIDLYRVEDRQGLESLGLEDIFNETAIVIVEWPERLNLPTNWPVMNIHLEHVSEQIRNITID